MLMTKEQLHALRTMEGWQEAILLNPIPSVNARLGLAAHRRGLQHEPQRSRDQRDGKPDPGDTADGCRTAPIRVPAGGPFSSLAKSRVSASYPSRP
jgi:hypothetical protein